MRDYSKYKIEYITKRPAYVQAGYLLTRAFSREYKNFPSFVGQINFVKGGVTEYYWLYRDRSDFDEYLKFYGERMGALGASIAEINKNVLSIISRANGDDIKLFFKYVSRTLIFSATLRCIDIALQARLKSFLSDGEIALATVFDGETVAAEEERMLLELAAAAMAPPLKDRKLKQIYENHKWIYYGLHDEKPPRFAEYKKQFGSIERPEKRLHDLEKRKAADLSKRDTLIFRLDSRQKKLARMAQRAAYLKDRNKAAMDACFALSHVCYKKIARGTKTGEAKIRALFPNELVGFLKGKKFDFSSIQARNKRIVFLGNCERWEVVTGDPAKEFENKYLKKSGNSDMRGRVAARGFARGTVKVVMQRSDFSKMSKGDILVVSNTTPDYVAVMKKAAAIVAEEGGITAHVSVVSREFGIPAVVGVASVTQILKDGDRVEVDAENGTVRKI